MLVDPKRESYDFGRFGWITDPERIRMSLGSLLRLPDAVERCVTRGSQQGITEGPATQGELQTSLSLCVQS